MLDADARVTLGHHDPFSLGQDEPFSIGAESARPRAFASALQVRSDLDRCRARGVPLLDDVLRDAVGILCLRCTRMSLHARRRGRVAGSMLQKHMNGGPVLRRAGAHNRQTGTTIVFTL